MKTTSTAIYDRMKQYPSFDPVIRTALREHPEMTRPEVEHKMDALLQWFSVIPIARHDGRGLQMLSNVDPMWHAFILNTRLYGQFCTDHLGEVVHHDPTTAMDPDAPRREYADYTLAVLRQEFGDRLNPELEQLQFDVKCCNRH